jgi:hypothetical protein
VNLSAVAMASSFGTCTACGDDAPCAQDEPFLHPKLGALLCERCYGRDTRVFDLDVRRPPHCSPLLFLHTHRWPLANHRAPGAPRTIGGRL